MRTKRNLMEETVFAVKNGTPSETVLRALTEVQDGEPAEMPPLYEVIDLDALDSLFRGPNPGTVKFDYAEYTFIVREDAEVVVKR